MERFFFGSMHAQFSAYNRYYYGLLKVKIIQDALANKTLSLQKACGVFPDGTFFSIPETGPVPLARSFSDLLSYKQQSLIVYLALPFALPGQASVQDSRDSSFPTRYVSSRQNITDEVFGEQSKEIELAKANYCILFEGEALDNFTTLPLARLSRTTNGQIVLDKEFIPPLLSVDISETLYDWLRSLLELLIAKSSFLSQNRKHLKSGLAEFPPSEITSLALLKTINTYIPVINNFFTSPKVHPCELYLSLIQLAGALTTFSCNINATELPSYDHNSLEKVFPLIFNSIREVLETDLSAGCVQIPFSEISPATYLFSINNPKLLETASFFIGISADIPEKELITFSLPRIKIASRNQLDILIQSAMPGLPLMYVSSPPPKLSSKPGYSYFALTRHNNHWEMIKTTGTMAMYFPHKIPGLKMEMIAVKETDS
jgi:type VI secretion system protein ImpJ